MKKILAVCLFVSVALAAGESGPSSFVLRPRGTGAGETGILKFLELLANGDHSIAFKAPDSMAANYVLTLPNGVGAVGQVLRTDGTGILSWVDNGAGVLTGSGTANYLTRWTAGSVVGNSLIRDDGANVAIGAAPSGNAKFDVVGKVRTTTQFESTQTTGTAPLVVASTTLVSNLNADYLDGQTGSYYQDAGNINAGTLAVARGGSGLASYTVGDLLYASGATTLSKLAGVATGNVLLSGGVATAPAWGQITDTHLASNAVTTVKITDANVTTAKIADLNVTAGKLASDAVTTAKILDANVTTAKIADVNVTTGKIADSAVTLAKLDSLARPGVNYLLNGGFDFAQRQGAATLTDAPNIGFQAAYAPDMWYILAEGNVNSGTTSSPGTVTTNSSNGTITGSGTAFIAKMVGGKVKTSDPGALTTYTAITTYTSSTSIATASATTSVGGQTYAISCVQYQRAAGDTTAAAYSQYAGSFKQIATAQKFAVCQIVRSNAAYALRGRTVRFQCSIKSSSTPTMRVAIIGWNSTADTSFTAAQRNVVSTWANAAEANPGTSFISNSWAVVNYSAGAAASGTYATYTCAGTVPNDATNLAVLVWSSTDVTQNATVDITKAGLYVGDTARDWFPRVKSEELANCEEYFWKTFNLDVNPSDGAAANIYTGALGGIASGTNVEVIFRHPRRMLYAPTMTLWNPGIAGGTFRNGGDNGSSGTPTINVNSEGGGTIVGPSVTDAASYYIHLTADSSF